MLVLRWSIVALFGNFFGFFWWNKEVTKDFLQYIMWHYSHEIEEFLGHCLAHLCIVSYKNGHRQTVQAQIGLTYLSDA